MRIVLLLAIAMLLPAVTASAQTNEPEASDKKAAVKESNPIPNSDEINRMAARFAPTEIKVSTAKLSEGDKQALAKLVEAAKVINPLFMTQLWSKNLKTYEEVKADPSPRGKARAHYYWINKGPWSALDEQMAFLPDVPERKPLGANFYPDDMTKVEFETWVKKLSAANQELATGFFTVVRRDKKGKLKLVPYSAEYKAELDRAGALLKEAAALTDNATLKKFLNSRAEAFQSNDYYQSDMDWMDLDAPIDVTFGPYETYNDELFNYKAAFETYITLRDDVESNKLKAFTAGLQEIENNLPEDPKVRNPKLGASAPIRVVNSVYSSGDGDHGVQTAAYNLPNDERVVHAKGAKRVMLKNIQEAKFETVLVPIARNTLAKPFQSALSFDWFFTHILAHELMHGLGPQQITIDGKQTSPRQQLKELYSSIEEAKADATGLFALQYMMDHVKEMKLESVIKAGPSEEAKLYTTFLASAFRSLRFGITEAHGKGMAFQFNFLVDKGAFTVDKDGKYSVDLAKIKPAVRDLTQTLLTLEANGDYAAAKKMLDELVVIRPATKKMLDSLNDIPVDIEPLYVTANELAPSTAATPTPAETPTAAVPQQAPVPGKALEPSRPVRSSRPKPN